MLALLEAQTGGVDAVSQTGRTRSVWEHMTQVAMACGAKHLDTGHSMAAIDSLDDLALINGIIEARPTAPAVKLLATGEQKLTTALAHIFALLVVVIKLTRERSLRTRFAQYVITIGA